jgi:hypothetical protein
MVLVVVAFLLFPSVWRCRECGRGGGGSTECWKPCECAGESVRQMLACDHGHEGSMATTE